MDWQNEETEVSTEESNMEEIQDSIEDSAMEDSMDEDISELTEESEVTSGYDVPTLEDVSNAVHRIKLHNEETKAKTIENAGRAMEAAGSGVELAGGTVQATGKGMQVAGKTTELAGKGTEAVGAAVSKGGEALTQAGTSLSSTGAGAVAGVPLAAVGTAVTGVGKGTEVAGKATQTAGQAIDKAGQSVDNAGRNIRQSGKQLRYKGKEVKDTGTSMRQNIGKKNTRGVGILPRSKSSSTNTKTSYQSNFGLPKEANLKIKMPKTVKIILVTLVITLIFIFLLFFIILFSERKDSLGSGVAFTYGQTCTSVTVTNTENYINDGTISFNDYIAGVVAAESGGSTNLEYLKYLTIVARTYSFKNIGSNCIVDGNWSFQNYEDINDASNKDLIIQALMDTNGLVIVKDGDLVDVDYNNSDDAFDLIQKQNYNYEQVIKEYYGDDVEIVVNELKITGKAGFVNPTRYIVCGSSYGERTHPVSGDSDFHYGLDISIPGGEPIYAAKSGVVTKVVTDVTSINSCDYGYGNYIVIEHEDGFSTLYAHIKYKSIPSSITVGSKVSQGQQIGQVGSTGCSTGNHLHYEVKVNGVNVDPADYLDLTGSSGTCKK